MGRGSAPRGAGGRTSRRLNVSPGRARSSGSKPPAAAHGPASWFENAADLATLALVAIYLATLARFAAAARFQTDECFHAGMSAWIAAHGTLPREIPELYSGFGYFYPPLFHILGAAWIKALGTDAFRYLNVFITALLLAGLAFGLRGTRVAARWAVLLCVANSWLVHHALRLYVEQLTALLAAGAVLLALELRRAPRTRTTLALGAVAGLAVVAKLSMLALPALLIALAGFYAIRRERNVAGAFAVAAGVALLVASPLFIRNALLFGSPIYPALAPDQNALLYELNRARFTPSPMAFYHATATHTGLAIQVMALAGFVMSIARRRGSLEVGLLASCVLAALAGPLQPMLDPRHLLPIIVVAAALGSLVVARQIEWLPASPSTARARIAITVVLLLLAARSLAPMNNPRRSLDLWAPLAEAFEAVRRSVPEGETVLSLWTYDTWFYSGRPATWPIPWSQKDPPLGMFLTANCDSVMLALNHHQLRYLLVPRQTGAVEFSGVNYPRGFMLCVGSLIEQERLQVLWSSPGLGLVKVVAPPGTN